MVRHRLFLTLAALFVGLLALTALAQEAQAGRPAGIQNLRPDSQLGLTVFETRNWSRVAVGGVFRFAPREQLFVGARYVGARYNSATGRFAGFESDVTIDRYEIGAGWFVTPNVRAKGAYVNQPYEDFPHENIHCGGEFTGFMGEFNGFMIEGVVAC